MSSIPSMTDMINAAKKAVEDSRFYLKGIDDVTATALITKGILAGFGLPSHMMMVVKPMVLKEIRNLKSGISSSSNPCNEILLNKTDSNDFKEIQSFKDSIKTEKHKCICERRVLFQKGCQCGGV